MRAQRQHGLAWPYVHGAGRASTNPIAAKRMRCPSRPRARLSASSATSKSTALGARTLKRRVQLVWVWVRRDRVFFLGVGFPYS